MSCSCTQFPSLQLDGRSSSSPGLCKLLWPLTCESQTVQGASGEKIPSQLSRQPISGVDCPAHKHPSRARLASSRVCPFQQAVEV